jgi:hypothetical protein
VEHFKSSFTWRFSLAEETFDTVFQIAGQLPFFNLLVEPKTGRN